MTTDESLMLEFQRGSRDAFEELYARYCGPVYGFFRRRVGNHSRAEELAQETFLAVIRGAERYEPRALVRTYLYGIALKLLAAEKRKGSRDLLIGQSVAAEPKMEEPLEAMLWVQQAIAKLDSGEREILMLREYEQLSYTEIAELLRLPLNTVRSRLFRARVALKNLLHPNAKPQDPEPSRCADSSPPLPGRGSVTWTKGEV